MVAVVLVITVFAALVPFCRAWYGFSISYNEGWNVYNGQRVVEHQALYPVPYGWTSLNYPPFSFWLMAGLHRVTHEYLFTARAVSIVSLLLCSVLVGATVHTLGASLRAAVLAGLFCQAMFCANADLYVGVDDPQLLAQALFLLAFLVYLRRRGCPGLPLSLTGVALLFAVAGFVKHNQIEFPLAVFVDLAMLSLPLATWFAVSLVAFVAAGVVLSTTVSGAYFVTQLLSPRVFLPDIIPLKVLGALGPVLPQLGVALYAGWVYRRSKQRRILAVLLVVSMVTGSYFSGGVGVSVNAMFSALVAVAALLGMLFSDLEPCKSKLLGWLPGQVVPLVCILALGIPLILSGNWSPWARLREAEASEKRFRAEVAFVRGQPGVAFCEDLLLCFVAGKPYVYDPFNATRLLRFRKLDLQEVLGAIQDGTIALVQADAPLERNLPDEAERFAPEIKAAVLARYRNVSADPGMSPDGPTFYVPR